MLPRVSTLTNDVKTQVLRFLLAPTPVGQQALPPARPVQPIASENSRARCQQLFAFSRLCPLLLLTGFHPSEQSTSRKQSWLHCVKTGCFKRYSFRVSEFNTNHQAINKAFVWKQSCLKRYRKKQNKQRSVTNKHGVNNRLFCLSGLMRCDAVLPSKWFRSQCQ